MAASKNWSLQNSLGRNRMPEHFIYLFIYFFEYSGIQFNSLTCDLRDTMPRQRSLTFLPREAEDFPWGDRYFKHVPRLTYLIYLSPKELYVLGLFKRYSYIAMKHNVIKKHKNLLLRKFELFSPQAKRIDSLIFYPFSHMATQSTMK